MTGASNMSKKPKIVKAFKETPIWHDDSKTLSKDTGIHDGMNNARLTAKTYGKKPLKSVKKPNYDIELWEYVLPASPNRVNVLVFCLVNNKVVGYIRSEIDKRVDADEYAKFPTIEISVVQDEYQGQGMGSSMYDMLMSQYGGFKSDTTLSGEEGHGSYDIWDKLGKKYHAYLYDEENRTVKEVPKFTRDMLSKKGRNSLLRFLVTRDSIV